MDIEFLVTGKVSIFVKDFIEESIALFGEDICAKGSSPEKYIFTKHRRKCAHSGQARITHPEIYSFKIIWVEKWENLTLD